MVTIIFVCLLTFVVHFTGTLAYSTRISGVLSGKLALSISLSNILSIVSRSAGVLIIPMLSRGMERAVSGNMVYEDIPHDYVLILLLSVLGTITGIALLRQFIKLLYYTVNEYVPGDNTGFLFLKEIINLKTKEDISLKIEKVTMNGMEQRYLFLNMLITIVYTSATLASIYCGYLVPRYRVTSLSFSFIINGLATFLFVTVIDPYISSLTDRAMKGEISSPVFYFRIRRFMYSRLAGVVVSVFTFNLFVSAITKCLGLLR